MTPPLTTPAKPLSALKTLSGIRVAFSGVSAISGFVGGVA